MTLTSHLPPKRTKWWDQSQTYWNKVLYLDAAIAQLVFSCLVPLEIQGLFTVNEVQWPSARKSKHWKVMGQKSNNIKWLSLLLQVLTMNKGPMRHVSCHILLGPLGFQLVLILLLASGWGDPDDEDREHDTEHGPTVMNHIKSCRSCSFSLFGWVFMRRVTHHDQFSFFFFLFSLFFCLLSWSNR